MDLHSFPTLPFELRIIIWECLIEPRVVLLKTRGHKVYSSRPVPVILHVCHESRRVGLRIYNESPGHLSPDHLSLDGLSLEAKQRPPPLYFNPTIDTLYLSREFRLLFLTDTAISKYKPTTLHIEHNAFSQFLHRTVPARRNDLPVKLCLAILLKLETIALVVEDISKGDSDIELVDISDEPLARRISSHFRFKEELESLCGDDPVPKISFTSIVSQTPSAIKCDGA